jgi:hypothetical protein
MSEEIARRMACGNKGVSLGCFSLQPKLNAPLLRTTAPPVGTGESYEGIEL